MRDLSLHLMDIIENSIAAQASVVQIELDDKDGMLTVIVHDNGKGMDNRTKSKAEDPFYTTRTTRKIGLGLPLYKQNALLSGGSFELMSQAGKGTTVKAVFNTKSIDCIPLGDIGETIYTLIVVNPAVAFSFTCSSGNGTFSFSTEKVKETLGEDIPLNHPDVSMWIKNYLYEGIKEIFGGVL